MQRRINRGFFRSGPAAGGWQNWRAGISSGRAKLQAKREDGRIVVDEKTTLDGIPPEAWEYKLGGRSALEWVLDQHKEKKVKDTTVAKKFPPSPFSSRKEEVIELLRRVCTVSVETVKIIRKMESEKQ